MLFLETSKASRNACAIVDPPPSPAPFQSLSIWYSARNQPQSRMQSPYYYFQRSPVSDLSFLACFAVLTWRTLSGYSSFTRGSTLTLIFSTVMRNLNPLFLSLSLLPPPQVLTFDATPRLLRLGRLPSFSSLSSSDSSRALLLPPCGSPLSVGEELGVCLTSLCTGLCPVRFPFLLTTTPFFWPLQGGVAGFFCYFVARFSSVLPAFFFGSSNLLVPFSFYNQQTPQPTPVNGLFHPLVPDLEPLPDELVSSLAHEEVSQFKDSIKRGEVFFQSRPLDTPSRRGHRPPPLFLVLCQILLRPQKISRTAPKSFPNTKKPPWLAKRVPLLPFTA